MRNPHPSSGSNEQPPADYVPDAQQTPSLLYLNKLKGAFRKPSNPANASPVEELNDEFVMMDASPDPPLEEITPGMISSSVIKRLIAVF